jgi:hypothetical protein
MNCGEDDSPPYIASYQNGPYSSSIASSASSSSASVWSDASSQSSDDTSVSGAFPSDSETSETFCCTTQEQEQGITVATYWPKARKATDVALEQRQHPRRTSIGAHGRTGCPPSLVRQCDRKVNFVDSLVGKIQCNPPISSLAQ